MVFTRYLVTAYIIYILHSLFTMYLVKTANFSPALRFIKEVN